MRGTSAKIVFFFSKEICCGYILEVSHQEILEVIIFISLQKCLCDFQRKSGQHFISLLWRQFAINVEVYFLGKVKKKKKIRMLYAEIFTRHAK